MSSAPRFSLADIDDEQLARAIAVAFDAPGMCEGIAALSAGRLRFGGTTWEAGGCLMVAEGLRRLFGGRLVGITDFEDDGPQLHHVALAVSHAGEERLLDRFGIHADLGALLDLLLSVYEWVDPAAPAEFDGAAVVNIAGAGDLLFDEALTARFAEYVARGLPAKG